MGMGRATVHTICNLAVMLQASNSDEVWNDLLVTIFSFVNDQSEAKIDTGLKLLTGLYPHLYERLAAEIKIHGQIFEKTLSHPTLTIKLGALMATCSFL